MADPWTLLMNGNIIASTIAPYTNILGSFFWVFLYFLGFMLIYMKTQNLGTAGIAGFMLSGIILTVVPPDMYSMIYGLMALSIATVLYKAYKG